jgi:putative transposase
MKKSNELRTGRHCVFNLHAHLVFVTKYRGGALDADAIERLRSIFGSICDRFDSELLEMNGEADHVHLLVRFQPKVALTRLVNSLKGASSRRLKNERPDLAERYFWKGALWSPSYYAGSAGGAPIEEIKAYVESQRTPG